MSLEAARIARGIRADVKSHLGNAPTAAAARTIAAEHIDSPHDALRSMPVGQLVSACRGVGRWHRNRMLTRARVDPERRVGELTDRERIALVVELRKPWPRERGTA